MAIASVDTVESAPSRPVALGEVCARGRGGELIALASTPWRGYAAMVSRASARGIGRRGRDTTPKASLQPTHREVGLERA
jgi:hypothetical protein